MDPDRRFSEEEVAEILDRATEIRDTDGSPSGPAGGLTLRELHEIGQEVGIPEDAITRAAASLAVASPEPSLPEPRLLGQTIGVSRTVFLPRRLSEHEWNRLVVELRETFEAKGRIGEDGAFRQWTNGNLHVLLEPTESGERLRLRTVKGSARPYQTVGSVFTAVGVVFGTLGVVDPRAALMYLLMGTGFLLGSRLTIPGWARTRGRQFDAIVARVSSWLGSPAVGGADDREALPDGGAST